MLYPKLTVASPEVVLCGCQIREMNAALTVPPKREYAKCSCPALFRAIALYPDTLVPQILPAATYPDRGGSQVDGRA